MFLSLPMRHWACAAVSGTMASMIATASLAGAPAQEVDEGPLLLATPSTDLLIRDGDRSVVDTVLVYLDGCPLLSLTPDTSGGPPEVTMIPHDGDCTPAVGLVGSVPASSNLGPTGVVVDDGLHVQLWRDDASGDDVGPEVENPGHSLIVDISNLGVAGSSGRSRGRSTETPFWVPGWFGAPSEELIYASDESPNGATGGGGQPGLFGGPTGGPNGGGGGGGSDPRFPTPAIFEALNDGPIPVPLPTTLLLLLGALYALRRVVHRK